MNYAALKCALHNGHYSKFCKILRKMGGFSEQEDEIFTHACFFGKTEYVKTMIKSNVLHNERNCYRNAVPICLKRRMYNILDIIFDELLSYPDRTPLISWSLHYFGQIRGYTEPQVKPCLKLENFEYCYNKFLKDHEYKNFFIPIMLEFIQTLITNLKILLNGRIQNKYLMVEIIHTHSIAAKEFTLYKIFKMI